MRNEAAKTLDYDVLIHLDRVMDYSPLPNPGSQRPDNVASGAPDDEPTAQWPVVHRFSWSLGVRDGDRPQRRVSAHDRLGGRRDRSPPHGGAGGGAGGAGFPGPSVSRHGPARSSAWGPGHGSGAGHGGPSGYRGYRGYRGRRRCMGDGAQRGQAWQKKVSALDALRKEALPSSMSSGGQLPFSCKVSVAAHRTVDPMDEEASQTVNGSGSVVSGQHAGHGLSKQMETNGLSAGGIVAVQLEDLIVLEEPDQAEQEGLIDNGDSQCLKKPENSEVVLEAPTDVPVGANLEVPAALSSDVGLSSGQFVPAVSCDGLGMTVVGPMLDLNVECVVEDEAQEDITIPHGVQGAMDHGRQALVEVVGRLNKVTKDCSGHRVAVRNASRFVVPLKKSLLCNPAPRAKQGQLKQAGNQENVPKKLPKAGKKKLNLSIDDQATMLLMTAAGITGCDGPSGEAHKQFGEQLAAKMQSVVVGNMRGALGLPENGGSDRLKALVDDAIDDEVV